MLHEDVDRDRLSLLLVAEDACVALQRDGDFVVPTVFSGAVPYQVLLDHAVLVHEGVFEVPVGTLRSTIDLRDLSGPAVDLRLEGGVLRGGVLHLLDSAGELVFEARADGVGRVPLTGVPPGTYRAEVRSSRGAGVGRRRASWSWLRTPPRVSSSP